jgi:hypothetical protein
VTLLIEALLGVLARTVCRQTRLRYVSMWLKKKPPYNRLGSSRFFDQIEVLDR